MSEVNRESNRAGSVGAGLPWLLSALLVVASAGCTSKSAPDAPPVGDTDADVAEAPKAAPAPNAAPHEGSHEGAGHEGHEDHKQLEQHQGHEHAAATPGATAEAVAFIHANAGVRQDAATACRQMSLCTYFQPADRGGEQGMIVSAPENTELCLVSRVQECELALDKVAALEPPKAIRVDYRQWAHNADELQLGASRMALELVQEKKLKVKKEGKGWQGFWTVWAAKHFPDQSAKALDMESRAEVTRKQGMTNLTTWLTEHGACGDVTPCTPVAVEKGAGKP